MKSYNNSILHLLYGFIIITAIISVLEAAVYAYMHYGLINGYMIRRFSYYIPCFSIAIYNITAVSIGLYVHRKIKKNKSFKLHKLTLVICILIAIGFQLYTERVSDWHLTVLFDDLSKSEYMSSVNFGRLFEIVEFTTLVLRWLCISLLILVFSYKVGKENN